MRMRIYRLAAIRTLLCVMKLFILLLMITTLFLVGSDAKPWPGTTYSLVLELIQYHYFVVGGRTKLNSPSYLNALHRNRRNHKKDRYEAARGKNYDVDDMTYYDDEDDYIVVSKVKREGNDIHSAINRLLELESIPLRLDYQVDTLKPLVSGKRTNKLSNEQKMKLISSKLRKIRALEERLRHVEEMKEALQARMIALQQIKHEEKMKIDREVSAAEREWKYNVDRLHPGSYRPLDSLGDESHLF